MVDSGRQYVERCASEHAALAAVLADGAVRLAAKRTARLWKRACGKRVAELRRSQALTAQMALSHAHRAATEIKRAFITKARPAQRRRVSKRSRARVAPHACAALHVFDVPGGAEGRPAALAECVALALNCSAARHADALAGLPRIPVWIIIVTLLIEQVCTV